MTAQHCLVGYDRKTDAEKFSQPVPESVLPELRGIVSFDDDDPKAYSSYELTYMQARRIAGKAHITKPLPEELTFFLEAYADE
jgi:hypothetical protein